MSNFDLPLGLGMAFAQNERAMAKFESMSDADKRAFVERSHNVSSRTEMDALVNSLTDSTGV